MPLTSVFHADVSLLQILDENGSVDSSLSQNTLTDDEIVELYQEMLVARHFDETAFKLQRSGRMGTYPQNKGEEATDLGAAKALKRGVDHIVPYYRENAALFHHGLPMHQVLLYWMGDERGNSIPSDLCINPVCVAIGTQILHATGIAWAFKLRKEPRVVLCFFGEGATSTGDFHSAMNFASLMKVPVVFCCVNNAYAISVPFCRQTASQTFAQKAIAYDMPTIQVDGNDIFAVYKAHREAVDRARSGGGPSFIEALTFRLGDHTTADDARRYRPAEELQAALARDPLVRTKKYLVSRGLWDDQRQMAAEQHASELVRDAVQTAMGVEMPKTEELFDHTFAELPDELLRQRQTLRTDSIGQDPSQIGLAPPKEPGHGDCRRLAAH